jgi:N-acetyl-alpha-D-muramate 1-phosphate uridylyltransferase
MSLPVAILAGGLATRLGPLTERIPKSLVDVGGRPFIAHQLELLSRHGLTDVVLLAGHLGEMLRDTLGNGDGLGVRLRYVFDGPAQLGTGGAVRAALAELGEAFLVLYGDSYLECDYEAIQRAFLAGGRSALMTVCRNDDRWDRSNVQFESGRVVKYDKVHRIPEMHHIDYGLGAFRRAAFARRPADKAFDLASVYQELLARGDLAGYEVGSRFYEIGSPAGLEETRAHLAPKGTAGR